MLTRLGFGLLWLSHFLPLGALTAVGNFAGTVGYYLARSRRRIGRVNLALCFPDLLGARAGATPEAPLPRVRSIGVRARRDVLGLEGAHPGHGAGGRHRALSWPGRESPSSSSRRTSSGVDMAAARLATEYRACGMYARQSNSIADEMLARGRNRFGNAVLFARHEGLLPVLQAMKEGLPFLYSPDMDFGAPHSIFVPFFGVPPRPPPGFRSSHGSRARRCCPLIVAQRPGQRRLRRPHSAAARRFPERGPRGRHAPHERVHRGAHPRNAGAIPLAAQALQDPPRRRAGSVRASSPCRRRRRDGARSRTRADERARAGARLRVGRLQRAARRVRRALSPLLSRLSAGRVLDLGCGPRT